MAERKHPDGRIVEVLHYDARCKIQYHVLADGRLEVLVIEPKGVDNIRRFSNNKT